MGAAAKAKTFTLLVGRGKNRMRLEFPIEERERHRLHKRWVRSRHTFVAPLGPKATYQYNAGQQCLHCKWYVPLEGALGADWGVCGNPRSDADGRVVFEHYSCDSWKYGKSVLGVPTEDDG